MAYTEVGIDIISDDHEKLPENMHITFIACANYSDEMGMMWLDDMWFEDLYINGEKKEARELDDAVRHYLEDYAWEMMG